jgi:cytochrome c peroxidase
MGRIIMVKTVLTSATILAFTVSAALAAGSASLGKTLFNDPKFAGAMSGKSCNTCHPGGRGLEQAGSKKEFHIAGKAQKSLEEAVNACIVYAIDGKALDPKSDAMQNIVAYIKSLKSNRT